MKLNKVLVLASAIALAGCSDDPPTGPGSVSGSLSFNYTGAGATSAQTYTASGTAPANPETDNGTNAWAVGGVSTAENATVVLASRPVSGSTSTWDQIFVITNRTSAGTETIDSGCDDEAASNCTGIMLFFGTNASGTTASYTCFLTTGSVTLSNVSTTNVTGTFSGSGSCFSATGATSNITITNGTFNVGLTALLD
jgi:hypothetical protein